TGGARRTLPLVDGEQALSFTRDGRHLVSALSDGTALVWDVYAPPGALAAARAWDGLAGADSARAFDAVCRLVASPAAAGPRLRARLRPARRDAAEVRRRLAALASEDFEAREAASRELADLGGDAEAPARAALAATKDLEARARLAELLRELENGGGRGG